MRILKFCLFPFFIFLLLSCSSPEFKVALKSYQIANHEHHLIPMVNALKVLASVEPKEYQSKLVKAEKALTFLTKADKYFQQKNYYQAYLASHFAYRMSLDTEAKRILQFSGRKLKVLLSIQKEIDQSFAMLPADFNEHLSVYKLPIEQWDLVRINKRLKVLNKSRQTLDNALNKINTVDITIILTEISAWQLHINKLAALLKAIKNAYINTVQYQSAKALLKHSRELRQQSIKLLALVRPSFAKKTMLDKFKKTKKDYQSYRNIVENIALASASSPQDLRSGWYVNWRKMENSILQASSPFSYYPQQAKQTQQKLEALITEYQQSVEVLENVIDLTSFNKQHKKISKLIFLLIKDKALVL